MGSGEESSVRRAPPLATPTLIVALCCPQEANYYGSLTQSGTVSLGLDAEGQEVFVPFSALLPMVAPDDLVFDGGPRGGGRGAGLREPGLWAGPSVRVALSPPPGWDISSLNLAEAMRRAQVLDCGLQERLWPHMEALRPRPSVYIPEFIAANQNTRADNLIPGTRIQQVPSLVPGPRPSRSVPPGPRPRPPVPVL